MQQLNERMQLIEINDRADGVYNIGAETLVQVQTTDDEEKSEDDETSIANESCEPEYSKYGIIPEVDVDEKQHEYVVTEMIGQMDMESSSYSFPAKNTTQSKRSVTFDINETMIPKVEYEIFKNEDKTYLSRKHQLIVDQSDGKHDYFCIFDFRL